MPEKKSLKNSNSNENKLPSASPHKYICPACSQGFDKTVKLKGKKGVYCPNCEKKLILQRGRDETNSKFTISYNLAEPGISWTPDPRQYEKPKPKPKVYAVEALTPDGNNPSIVKMNDDSYRVVFIRPALGHMIRCPQCNKAIWQNNDLGGKAEYKCPRCKSMTTFIFLRDGNIASVIDVLTVSQSQ